MSVKQTDLHATEFTCGAPRIICIQVMYKTCLRFQTVTKWCVIPKLLNYAFQDEIQRLACKRTEIARHIPKKVLVLMGHKR
jgi:hypothetical protein